MFTTAACVYFSLNFFFNYNSEAYGLRVKGAGQRIYLINNIYIFIEYIFILIL